MRREARAKAPGSRARRRDSTTSQEIDADFRLGSPRRSRCLSHLCVIPCASSPSSRLSSSLAQPLGIRPGRPTRPVRWAWRRRRAEDRRFRRVQRRLAGILAVCRRREHVGAERRVPVRLEAHDRRFHPAGARRAPRQGRRSPPQGGPDGAPQPGRRRSLCRRRGARRRPHLAAVPAHQRRDHRTGRVGRQGRGRHPDRAEGPDLHLLGREVRRAVHDLRGLERQPR